VLPEHYYLVVMPPSRGLAESKRGRRSRPLTTFRVRGLLERHPAQPASVTATTRPAAAAAAFEGRPLAAPMAWRQCVTSPARAWPVQTLKASSLTWLELGADGRERGRIRCQLAIDLDDQVAGLDAGLRRRPPPSPE